MSRKKARNYDQTAFKVGASPQPADDLTPEREKRKVTRGKAATGGDEDIARAMGRDRKE